VFHGAPRTQWDSYDPPVTSPRTVVDDKLDDAGAFPEIRRLRKAVGTSTWKPVAEAFGAFTDDHARSVAISSAAQVAGGERLFRAAMRPDAGTLPQVLLAARHIALAFHARGAGRFHGLTYDQYHVFQDRLYQAEQLLIEVCAVEPANVHAWEQRLHTAVGLELDASEKQRRYERLAALNPTLFTAQFRRLQTLCPKWGGDWDSALAFARETSAAAEPGSLSPALIPTVHLERYFDNVDDTGVLTADEVQREVAEAARISVLHRDFRKTYQWVQAQGTFALYYSLIDQPRRAAPHYRAMGTLASAYPWSVFEHPAAALALHRGAALEKG
jgi:hypothetical protein